MRSRQLVVVWNPSLVKVLNQHETPCSTAQHICALQHNATIGIIHIPSIVLAAIWGQLGQLGKICITSLETALIKLFGLNK